MDSEKRHQRHSRRRFLANSGAAVASLAAPYFVPSHVLGQAGKPGPNSRINIGMIGIGIRGKYQIGNIPPEGRVAAICDWYAPRMDFVLQTEDASQYAQILAAFRQNDARSCAKFQDYRQMIETAKLDAVMITACDHHHVQAAILACQAGLDVYVEKPLSVYIREGRALVNAAKKHNRVVQVGSQQRTMEMNQFACKFIREGGLGKVSRVTLPNYPGPLRYEDQKNDLPEQKIPSESPWELFCGPTPLRPYHQKLWAKEELAAEHFTWRGWDMWRDYSGHMMTNHAAHTVDMVQLALGTDDTGPVEVQPRIDGYNGEMRLCPVSMKYASGVELQFASPGELYVGEKGTLNMRRNAFSVNPPELVKDSPDPEVRKKWTQPARRPAAAGVRGTWDNENVAGPHIQNWLDCIRTRAQPNAPVEAGHRSVTICHLANIARELRRTLRWDPAREVFVGDEEADRLLDRPRRPGFELPT